MYYCFLGAMVGSDNFTAIAFVNVDASNEINQSYFYVRGKQNSIILLEQKSDKVTKVTLIIEKDTQG